MCVNTMNGEGSGSGVLMCIVIIIGKGGECAGNVLGVGSIS